MHPSRIIPAFRQREEAAAPKAKRRGAGGKFVRADGTSSPKPAPRASSKKKRKTQ